MNDARLVIHNATLASNRLLRSTLDGREQVIVPVVALVAGVVNGELVPIEELAAFVAAWDGRPVPLRHPQDAAGNYISVNNPAIIESSVVGQVFGMTLAGDRLVGELWLDVAKCARLGGDAMAVLQRLERGEVVKVSTAYFCNIKASAGTFNGQPCTAVQCNLRPDHVALLPDQIGACSIADGCGAGRFNSVPGAAAACRCADSLGESMNDNQDEKAASLATMPATQGAAPPAPPAAQPATPPATAPAANETAAPADAPSAIAPAAEVAPLQLPAELTELAAALREFGGVSALIDAVKSIKANSDRQRTQIVNRLAANSRCAFSKAELEAMGLDTLTKLEASIAPTAQSYLGRNGAALAANLDGGLRAYKGAAAHKQPAQPDAATRQPAQAEVKQ